MLVLVYRERFGKFTGPFDVIKVDDKQVWVAGEDNIVVQYNISQVKPFIEESYSDERTPCFFRTFPMDASISLLSKRNLKTITSPALALDLLFYKSSNCLL
jgi:hypothetical protein